MGKNQIGVTDSPRLTTRIGTQIFIAKQGGSLNHA